MAISASVLDAMVAAGCTAEQIAAAVKADMASDGERQAKKRANNAERQRRFRDRNAVSRVTSVTNGDNPSSSPAPLDPPSQTLPPIIPPTPSPPRETKRASRLPDDWTPDIDFAVSVGLSEAQARNEAAKFREWWPAQPGQKGVKLDWDLTWKTWCRKAAERSGGGARASPQPVKSEFRQRQDRATETMMKAAFPDGYQPPRPQQDDGPSFDLDPRDWHPAR